MGCSGSSASAPSAAVKGVPRTSQPEGYPDLSKHSNCMAEILTKEMYERLSKIQTPMGYTIDDAIRTGVKNPGHPHIKTVGATAGDEDSFSVFSEFFTPVIKARMSGFRVGIDKHPTLLDPSKLPDAEFDTNYVLTSRVRAGRNIRGFRLPPSIHDDERWKLEKLIIKACEGITGECSGTYKGLYDMTDAEHEGYIDEHIMFEKPVSPLLIASGMASHWPNGRGMFVNAAHTFIVWSNEEDHIRVVSMEKGGNMKAVFTRWVDGLKQFEKGIKNQGYDFMHTKDLGYIHTCPSNLGTGIRCGVHLRVPKLSEDETRFRDICKKFKLQTRGTGGVDAAATGGTFDVSNSDRIGMSETDLVLLLINGVNKMIELEKILEKGQSIDGKW